MPVELMVAYGNGKIKTDDKSKKQKKVVYLMRGLNSTGKSWTARKLVGMTGIVCETDSFFWKKGEGDRLEKTGIGWKESRKSCYKMYKEAVKRDCNPIVVDRGNGLSKLSYKYARYGIKHGYDVQLVEPLTWWWSEIRDLLETIASKQYKKMSDDSKLGVKNELDKWAIRLTRISAGIHRVPEEKIRKRLQEYNVNLTIEDILNYKKEEKDPMTKEDKKKLIKEAEEMHGKKDPRTKKLRKELKDIK